MGLWVALASSQAMAADMVSPIMKAYHDAALTWVGPLQADAQRLFMLLFTIQLCWGLGSLALRGADLSEFLAELVNQIMHYGIFFYLVTKSSELAGQIIKSFTDAAAQVSGAPPTPTGVLNAGVNMASTLLSNMSANPLNYGIDLVLVLCGLICLVCMAYIAALMVMINVETYIVVSALTLFTGFGGSRWTKDYALRSLTYAMSAGGKLFMLNLVVAAGSQIITDMNSGLSSIGTAGGVGSGAYYQTLLTLAGSVFVLVGVCKSLPDMIGSLLSGASIGSNAALAGMGRGAAATAAAGGVGAVMAGAAASSLASAQVGAAPGVSRLGNAARMVGLAGRNLAGAAVSDVGNRLSGKPGANHGVMGGRMAASMNKERDDLRSPPPKPPAGSGDKAPPDPGNTIRSS
ncbi:MAG: P-type conjugative transfer protein TrbL [Acetobacteraceae bacterium]|nr:P-type conjugative transfer protein TrbL [Acetobacteraceae bacterium]